MISFIDVVRICFLSEAREDEPEYEKCTDIYLVYLLLNMIRRQLGGIELSLVLEVPRTDIETEVEIIMNPERDVVLDLVGIGVDSCVGSSDALLDLIDISVDSYLGSSDALLDVPSISIEVEVQ